MDLKGTLRLHALYLQGDPAGVRANLTGANLTEAYLAGANLTRANLTGANLAGASLTGANLTGANLTDANLTGASLAGANLTDANLAEVCLTGANLAYANLTGTKVLTFQADHYRGYTVPGVDGKRILKFGCVRLTLDEWDTQHDELAERHEPGRAAKFAALTRSIVATCRALDL